MNALRLTWKRKQDLHQSGFVIGSPEAIQDLYWQLTHNYQPVDGTAIGEVSAYNLNGVKLSHKDLMSNAYGMVYPTTNIY